VRNPDAADVHALYARGMKNIRGVEMDDFTEQVDEIHSRIIVLYKQIEDAIDSGEVSYTDIVEATGFARGTVQNIVDGRRPRFTVRW
jgi:hypothetical protein